MKKLLSMKLYCLLVFCATATNGWSATPEIAPTIKEYLRSLESNAKVTDPNFSGFSAERGKKLYHSQRSHSSTGETRSCITCHTIDPRQVGQTNIGKPVDPLAPIANNQRLRDASTIEKWFQRNCTWVLERECSSSEKGDIITYLFSI